MTMEEGLRKGLQEWQRTSNFDRMVFYETAEKFMEFEAAEEMEDPRMQLSGVFQCRPPPATPRLEIRRPPVPEAVQQPVCTSRKINPKVWSARSLAAKPKAPETKVPETKARKTKARKNKVAKTKGPENKAPEEIPPEAIQQYMDIMDELFGPTNFATWEPSYLSTEELAENLGEEGLEQQPIQDDLYPDPSLLSYVDENFVNKDTRASEAAAKQGAEKRKHHTDQGASMEDWSTEVASQVVKRSRTTEPELLGPKDTAILQGCHGSSSLGTIHSNHPPQNCRSSSLNLGNKSVVGPRKATSSGRPHKTANGCSVDEDLQSLDFLLNSQHRLLPWELSQSQAPPIETLCSGDQAIQAPPPQRGLLSSHPPPGAMSMKSALTGRTCFMKKTPCTGPPLQVTAGQDVDLELAQTSQPQKRKCTSSGNQKKKRP
ncbi:Hypothetical predicted protein [Marmota monax]|uniref:Nuclear Testis protein N-terminal domain-containing protein n=1 Tax=Marmota monax TaxID=9995 RepID=A0A5E4D787_MARMO|nr:Hypothetical predicted protein [Marmota monax]